MSSLLLVKVVIPNESVVQLVAFWSPKPAVQVRVLALLQKVKEKYTGTIDLRIWGFTNLKKQRVSAITYTPIPLVLNGARCTMVHWSNG